MEKEDAIWLAAAIDFEGHIVVERRNYRRGSPPVYVPKIGFTITHEHIARRCLEIAGVGYVTHRKYGKGNHVQWEWRCSCRKAVKVLKAIYPYLNIKKEQAKVSLAVQKLYGYNRWHLPPQEVLDERLRLFRLSGDVNQRRIVDSGLPEPELG